MCKIMMWKSVILPAFLVSIISNNFINEVFFVILFYFKEFYFNDDNYDIITWNYEFKEDKDG